MTSKEAEALAALIGEDIDDLDLEAGRCVRTHWILILCTPA
jgi:hypothetical protein